ncbi:MAG: hypothetical protein M5R36_28485 [Deltaproteobacteria bacterium]|nr:hypothetical protein [Deltaproteobacteria bacterium]
MAYYVGPNVEVFCAHYDGRGSQWDLWQDYRGLEGRDVIYADTKGASRKLFTHFDEAIELGTFPLGAEGRTAKTIYLFHLRGFHVDGELKRYFGTPFEDSRRRLLERVRSGDD